MRSAMTAVLSGLRCGLLITSLFLPSLSFGAHPLVSDDTGTQGKGNFQLEFNSDYGYDKDTKDSPATETSTFSISSVLSYGILENVDMVFGVPYQSFRTEKDHVLDSKEDGISDLSLELKWRFYEKEGLSYAVKPGLTFPTGDEKRGLGKGRNTFTLFFIATKQVEAWAFHLNLGYRQNENKVDERENLWHASLASEWKVHEKLRVVGNIGVDRNTDKTYGTEPAFIIGGLIYSLMQNLDIDIGIKAGLTSPETDYTLLAGIAFRF